jgi:hypothetical protein
VYNAGKEDMTMTVDLEPCGIERIGKKRTFGLKVRNGSKTPIPELILTFNCDNENPESCPDGSMTLGIGTALHALRDGKEFRGTLEPGQEHIFYLDENFLHDRVLSRVAALSPERYWVAVLSGDKEIARYDGRLFGGVLDGLFRESQN